MYRGLVECGDEEICIPEVNLPDSRPDLDIVIFFTFLLAMKNIV